MKHQQLLFPKRLWEIRWIYLLSGLGAMLAAFLLWRVPWATAVSPQTPQLNPTTPQSGCRNTADLLKLNPSTGRLSVSYGGTTEFHTLLIDPNRTFMFHYLLGDFNGDGITDLFTVDYNGQWYVSYSGTESFQKLGKDPNRNLTHQYRLGDFNGDGTSDVFTIDRDTGQWLVSFSGTGNYQNLAKDSEHDHISDYGFGDFNGDGITDVFTIHNYVDYAWRISFSGTESYQELGPTISGHPSLDFDFNDYNADGITDVFFVDQFGRRFVAYSGTGPIVELGRDPTHQTTKIGFQFGDITGDGITDLFKIDHLTGDMFYSSGGKDGYQHLGVDPNPQQYTEYRLAHFDDNLQCHIYLPLVVLTME